MLLPTPEKIRTLQRKLYIKAKQEPAYRFYALYDKVHRADVLSFAWALVKANKGSPGVDGLSFEAIERVRGRPLLRGLGPGTASQDLPGQSGKASHDTEGGWQHAPAGHTHHSRPGGANGGQTGDRTDL